MGEIKTQLVQEAEQDRAREFQCPTPTAPATPAPDQRSSLLGTIFAELMIGSARAQAARSDETVISLKPGEGVEFKLTMKAGGKVNFTWATEGGVVNYDMRGVPAGGGKEKSYKQGRGVGGDEGVLTDEGDGGQGW
jgi:hypothetical protein